MMTFLQDFRFAFRLLRVNIGFSAIDAGRRDSHRYCRISFHFRLPPSECGQRSLVVRAVTASSW
jgi:hypothetical protein